MNARVEDALGPITLPDPSNPCPLPLYDRCDRLTVAPLRTRKTAKSCVSAACRRLAPAPDPTMLRLSVMSTGVFAADMMGMTPLNGGFGSPP
jgi:hypothetical protein